MSELTKLVDNLEYLQSRGVKTIKLVFCETNIEIKKLLDEIKLRSNSL
jgi:hypothetical protein